MSYGRTTSTEEFDPQVVLALAQRLGLAVTLEDAKALATGLVSQLAAKQTIERFDLQDVAPVLKMEARWNE